MALEIPARLDKYRLQKSFLRNLDDVTFNERNYFTALFEKNESSYKNYRNQLMAVSCTDLIP